jgi:hypothetical protein
MNNGLSILRKLKWSTGNYGCDSLLREELGLSNDMPLPITIPHGIDFYHVRAALDLHCYEPIYAAFRDDIAERVSKYKAVVKFPHPWLLIIARHRMEEGTGTLFVAPPPSVRDFESMLRVIQEGPYPKPWGVLIKQRNVQQFDFDWWKTRGFSVHTAGPVTEKRFFYNLRDIFAGYQCIAAPNMSSALIFAVAMNRRVFALPNVCIHCVDIANHAETTVNDDSTGEIARTWRDLLSDDRAIARSRAEQLLGMKYMAGAGELRDRLESAIRSVVDRPVHLYPAGAGLFYRMCIWLIGKGVPVQKLFPHPLSKITNRVLSWLCLNRLSIYSGSDFAHFRVAGEFSPARIRKVFGFQLGKGVVPGHSVPDSVPIDTLPSHGETCR